MDIELTSPPDEDSVLELLTLTELKLNEHISFTEDDDRLEECIKGAYAYLDGRYGWLNRSLLPQTWTIHYPSLVDGMELPYGPVTSVDSITYFDSTNTQQTLASTEYDVDIGSIVPKVCKAYGVTWPQTYSRNRAVSITYTAGFGNIDTMDFPVRTAIKRTMMLLASHFYRNPSWTYAEPRLVAVNRVTHGVEHLIGFLRIPNKIE